MSNVQECIDLYLKDDVVTDAQFRAVIADAHERDKLNGDGEVDPTVRELLVNHGKSLVLLNRIDDLRRDHIDNHDREIRKLTGFCDSLAGQVRVLRERLEAVEQLTWKDASGTGYHRAPERLDNMEGK